MRVINQTPREPLTNHYSSHRSCIEYFSAMMGIELITLVVMGNNFMNRCKFIRSNSRRELCKCYYSLWWGGGRGGLCLSFFSVVFFLVDCLGFFLIFFCLVLGLLLCPFNFFLFCLFLLFCTFVCFWGREHRHIISRKKALIKSKPFKNVYSSCSLM